MNLWNISISDRCNAPQRSLFQPLMKLNTGMTNSCIRFYYVEANNDYDIALDAGVVPALGPISLLLELG
jgi:hypothetical protein